ncbi:family 31 glycosyltransferase [Microdochium trichocladiopsis]|uniref:Family 31 glycosyltransferase n=1 Tax=Microdochium trichocladiopsis TaxID=1682393 RepID=A0A9P8Y2Y1_9PEZI|nr:family 31 glycosyltransferase [Microdochium trichocladiopsis]KAH7026198.1 family 31 glycosyltransferase [Microdochium trichocladiopsis]
MGKARDYYQSVSSYLGTNGQSVVNNTIYSEGIDELIQPFFNTTSPCANFPNTENILLVMKTGATEAFDKVPTQLLTAMQCLPDFLIFSDMEQQIGSYHIYDALADFDKTTLEKHSDFELYRQQQDCPVSQKSCNSVHEDRQKAWNLDRYKFIPMMEKTWKMRPGRDWYVFAEADTYVFWSNLVYWLRHKSPISHHDKVYLGSRSFIGGTPFAHGGSGYVLSGALLEHLIEHHPVVVEHYNKKGMHECCGDLMLAQALDEYEHVKIRQTWPMFNGEKPSTLPYGPGHWCEPIFTMHHVNAEEISTTWLYEKTRISNEPILIRDLYEGLVAPKMVEMRQDWDNLSDDVCYVNPDPEAQKAAEGYQRDRQKKPGELNSVEKEAWKSWENCAKVCAHGDNEKSNDLSEVSLAKKRNRECFQYRWNKEVCCVSKSFKLGEPKEKSDKTKDRWMSGWYLKGINDWIQATGECKEPRWVTPEQP